ncbi:hypothetical protein [Streptomyces sp. NPDC021224]|uniref:hypothetical protein n=1 Tax=unclassified Streptomyces TaxID=2593676 RepID=UPI00378E505D
MAEDAQQRAEGRAGRPGARGAGGRREGLHAEADRLVDELAGYVRRLAARAGDDHPATLSALAAPASAEFASAEAAGERERRERAVGVLAVAAQRMAATLGGHHPRALAVQRGLAAAEYEFALTSGDARRLAGAEALMAEAGRRAEGQRPEERQERRERAEQPSPGAPSGPAGAALRDVAESLVDEIDLLLAEQQAACVRRGEDSRAVRRRFNDIRRQLLLARSSPGRPARRGLRARPRRRARARRTGPDAPG